MNQSVLKRIPLRANPFAAWPARIHWVIFCLSVLQFMLVLVRGFNPESEFGRARWPDGLLLVLLAGTTVASLSRSLPAQNVMLAAAIIAVIGSATHVLAILTAIPFGPLLFSDNIGQQLVAPLPWAIPLMWIVIILNSRGVGRLILRPWRKLRTYGFWLMGVTAVLVVILDVGLEPYAAGVRRFWLWDVVRGGAVWYTAPWINFFGWAMTALLILAFATPSLINKKPSKKRPPDYHPLIIWVLVQALFVTGAALNRMWTAVAVVTGLTLLVTVFAVRGARW